MIHYDPEYGADYEPCLGAYMVPADTIEYTFEDIEGTIRDYLKVPPKALTIYSIQLLTDLMETAYIVFCSYEMPNNVGQWAQLTLVVYETADGSLSVSDTEIL